MVVELITDNNYSNLKNYSRAALMVSITTCSKCDEFFHTLETIAKQNPQIKFGKTLLDQGCSTKLKREYPDIGRWLLPTTLLFREGVEIGRISGAVIYPQTFSKIQEKLLYETIAYVPDENGIYIPTLIKQADGKKGFYNLQLLEESSLGSKGSIICMNEFQIRWNSEDKR